MCLSAIVCSVKMLMSISVSNSKLFYTSVKFSEHQIHMIKNKYFDCSQKKHTQKNCSMHSFEKIHFLLNLKMNQSMNSVSQTDVKINMKSSASFTVKIMKLIMKSAAKSVMNMNTHINLNENTWTVFTKKIHIVLSVTSQITFSNESKNKLFWNQVAFQNTKKNLWCIYAFWASTRITEITHLSTWSAKYDFKKNELRHKFW